jgi:hypothetical protein
MKIRNLTVVAASAALAAMLTVGSAERAEAHRGWVSPPPPLNG